MKTFSWDFQELILHVKLQCANIPYAPVWEQGVLDRAVLVTTESKICSLNVHLLFTNPVGLQFLMASKMRYLKAFTNGSKNCHGASWPCAISVFGRVGKAGLPLCSFQTLITWPRHCIFYYGPVVNWHRHLEFVFLTSPTSCLCSINVIPTLCSRASFYLAKTHTGFKWWPPPLDI